jgi:chromosome segregation ATPase
MTTTTSTKKEARKAHKGDPLEGLLAAIGTAEVAVKAAEDAGREASSSEEFKALLEKDEVRRRIAALVSKLQSAVQQHADLETAQKAAQAELEKIQAALGRARSLGLTSEATEPARKRAAEIRSSIEKRDERIKQVWGKTIYGLLPHLGALGWAPKPGSAEATFVAEASQKAAERIKALRTRLCKPCGAPLPLMRERLQKADSAFGKLDFPKAIEEARKGLKLGEAIKSRSK